jgi:hypothetical protein
VPDTYNIDLRQAAAASPPGRPLRALALALLDLARRELVQATAADATHDQPTETPAAAK